MESKDDSAFVDSCALSFDYRCPRDCFVRWRHRRETGGVSGIWDGVHAGVENSSVAHRAGFSSGRFTMIYHFAPNVRPKKCKWWAWGTFVAIILWLLFSFGFRLYLHFFNSYGVTYGSLGSVDHTDALVLLYRHGDFDRW